MSPHCGIQTTSEAAIEGFSSMPFTIRDLLKIPPKAIPASLYCKDVRPIGFPKRPAFHELSCDLLWLCGFVTAGISSHTPSEARAFVCSV